MIETSRRGSVQTVQGFWVSILPQVMQTWILSIATCRAAESGVISASRFLIRCNAARRAERGPSPGSRASNWIRRSISGPATAVAISGQAQPRRQTKSAGQRLHLLLHGGFRLAPRVIMRGDQQVFEYFALVRLDQRGVDLHRLHFHLRGHSHTDKAATRNTLDLYAAEFFLHRLHLRVQLCRLFHHAEKVSHERFLVYLLLIVAIVELGRVFTASNGFRRLGGKLAHLDHPGSGKARQHLLDPRIGFGGEFALVLLYFVLRTQRRLSRFVGHDHGPAPSGPLLTLTREIVDQRPCGAALKCNLEPATFDAAEAD